MAKVLPPKGMRDFDPEECRKRTYMIDTIKKIYEKYGYDPIETPVLENMSVLLGKGGDESDKLMYKVMKRGNKLSSALEKSDATEASLADLGMRFEFTVSLARYIASNRGKIPKIFRRYQIGPVWRADRPQDGRFREFIQCDIDAIGESSNVIECENILATGEVLREFGLKDLFVRISDRRLLNVVFKGFGLNDKQFQEAMVIIDKLDKIGAKKVIEELKAVTDDAETKTKLAEFFEKMSDEKDKFKVFEEFGDKVKEITDSIKEIIETVNQSSKIKVLFDPSLARGLSYYTGTIFEIGSKEYNYSFGGGGRYDNLIGMFSGDNVPACGFSIGFERLYKLMTEQKLFPEHTNPVKALLMPKTTDVITPGMKLAQDLRAEGIAVEFYPNAEKLGKMFDYAEKKDIPAVVIMDKEQLEKGKVQYKELKTREESEETVKGLIKKLGK